MASWKTEEPEWLAGGHSRAWFNTSSQAAGKHFSACLMFSFQMNRSIKGTARKLCLCWCHRQSRVSVGGWGGVTNLCGFPHLRSNHDGGSSLNRKGGGGKSLAKDVGFEGLQMGRAGR